ncbi:serine/threonine-protein kinase TNNI3K-like isoform X1 [Homarus americanus]|uniref:serine/threonine-protein kinase TNNI3K-like isoform X1 n=1 Tax=Homarus americanus TaxID=6706 RepID=UPI001C456F24|nr:serine/threonine-protein kinase TNNI3K-like isoform X1 [Homarus americanus]XP_042213699.1 serine/threonine-protein kinase TNNI3K-like isoform X1 [Homarus americanus]
MGNYKSRPKSCCSQELLKKILENYAILEEKLHEDLHVGHVYDFTDLEKIICNGTSDQLVNRLGSETLSEKSDNGVTLMQLCCLSSVSWKNDEIKEKKEDNGADVGSQAPCFLQLVKPSREKANRKDGSQETSQDNKGEPDVGKHLAKIQTNKEIKDQIRLLLQKGADPAIISKNGFSALHLASYKGDIDLVRLFLEKCNHLDHTGAGSVTALHISCLAGHLQVTQALAQRGANIEARDAVSFSPLHIACLFGNESVVEYLLSRGVDVNIAGSVGDRPLHLAATRGYYKIVQMLLRKGARVRLQDEEGNTALHCCVQNGHFSILNLLLQPQYRTDAHISNVYLDTPLHVACYYGWIECAKALLTYGGSSLLLRENMWGETALHAACTGGQCIDLVDYLLSQDATSVNYQSPDGHTPLHSACYHGHTRIVQLLLSHGADINLTAHDRFNNSEKKEEQTPLMWAYDRGHDDIANFLKHFRRPGLYEDYARGDYLSGLDTSYFPIPSPIGKLRTMVQEKIDVLHLRSVLPPHLHLSLSEIESLENISSGSFGKVYKGKYNDKIVAVKRYRAHLSYGKSDVEMFCREVSVLGSLDSPYIVKFVGACLHDPSQFAIVTEYVPGGSLFSTLHEQKRSIDTITRFNIAIDVANGMYYLHTLPQPIIHRDLNSHNILLNNECRARVADFGESRFVRNIFEENMTKQPGNLRWMAPEVFTQCTRYSIKADVFSFGLCLWELLASELPFAHLKPAAAAADMAYRHSRPPLELAFPVEVSVLLEKAWHKVPEERPNFSQIIEELEILCKSQKSALQDGGDLVHPHHHLHACCATCSVGSPTGSTTPPDASQHTNSELSGRTPASSPPLHSFYWNGHVTALRTRWEQEASRGQTAFKSSHPTIEELRSRMNNNGYVEGNTYQYRIAPVFSKHQWCEDIQILKINCKSQVLKYPTDILASSGT